METTCRSSMSPTAMKQQLCLAWQCQVQLSQCTCPRSQEVPASCRGPQAASTVLFVRLGIFSSTLPGKTIAKALTAQPRAHCHPEQLRPIQLLRARCSCRLSARRGLAWQLQALGVRSKVRALRLRTLCPSLRLMPTTCRGQQLLPETTAKLPRLLSTLLSLVGMMMMLWCILATFSATSHTRSKKCWPGGRSLKSYLTVLVVSSVVYFSQVVSGSGASGIGFVAAFGDSASDAVPTVALPTSHRKLTSEAQED